MLQHLALIFIFLTVSIFPLDSGLLAKTSDEVVDQEACPAYDNNRHARDTCNIKCRKRWAPGQPCTYTHCTGGITIEGRIKTCHGPEQRPCTPEIRERRLKRCRKNCSISHPPDNDPTV